MIPSLSDTDPRVCVVHKFTLRNDVVGLGGRQFQFQSRLN